MALLDMLVSKVPNVPVQKLKLSWEIESSRFQLFAMKRTCGTNYSQVPPGRQTGIIKLLNSLALLNHAKGVTVKTHVRQLARGANQTGKWITSR